MQKSNVRKTLSQRGHIQLWNVDGIMMGKITPEKAAELVNDGTHHVINDQAIEEIRQ